MTNKYDLQSHKAGAYASALFSVVIVTYNSAETILPCLTSLLAFRQSDIEIAVVDNSSRDATVTLVRSFRDETGFPLVLIENSINNGYAKASNQGVRATTAPFVVFLNPDTSVPPLFLSRLQAHLADSSVAAVGPLSNFAAEGQSVVLHWHDPLPHAASPEQAAEYLYHMNRGEAFESKLLIGFCLMVRRGILEQLGGLDERLFLGADDLELSWRLRLHRHRLLIAKDCFVYHEGQHSFRTEPSTTTGLLVQQSNDALYQIMQEHYGVGRVPTPEEIWGIDWFMPTNAVFNPLTGLSQILSLPKGSALEEPNVSIIILTWNQLEYTKECLEALDRHTKLNHEIIIVDNGSTDGTPNWLKERAAGDSRLRLALNSDNRGFAAGCNQGLALAKAEWLILLNNDVVVTEGWLDGLLECHETTPCAGIVGPLTNNASGIQGIGPAPYQCIEEFDRFARDLRIANRHRRIFSRRLVGFCMLFHRSLLERIGGLDDRFGTGNYEDDDLCLRAAIAGFQNVVAADIYLHHHGSVSFQGGGLDYRAHMSGNWSLFREKWSTPVADPEYAAQIAACRIREDAEKLLLLQKKCEAVTVLKEALFTYPDDALLLDLYKRALRSAGEFQETARLGDRLSEARCLREDYHPDLAENLLFSLQSENPGCGELHLILSDIVRNRGEKEYADALLQYGFRLSPAAVAEGLLTERESGVISGVSSLLVQEAARLNPGSKAVAALHVLTAVDHGERLSAAENYIRTFGVDPELLEIGLSARRIVGHHKMPSYNIPAISLCMIVKNEEHHLPHCLSSCRPLVSQIVVVDTGSNDRSCQIAELFGAQLLHHQWQGDFSAARNLAIDAATGDWIFVMDADERFSMRDYHSFCQALVEVGKCAFTFTTRNYSAEGGMDGFVVLDGSYPEDEAGIGWTPSDKIRLFPNNHGIRFTGCVHELVEAKVAEAGIVVCPHPVPIHHYGGLESKRQERKREDYYQLGVRKLAEGEFDLKALYELAIQAAELGKHDEAIQLWLRFLQHEPGYAIAWFNLGYVCLRTGKLHESLEATKQALQIQPDYRAARVNLAICRFLLTPVAGQLNLLEKELREMPDEPTFKILMSLCRCLGGEVKEGIAVLVGLWREGINATLFLQELGRLFRTNGAEEEAELLDLLSTTINSGLNQI